MIPNFWTLFFHLNPVLEWVAVSPCSSYMCKGRSVCTDPGQLVLMA